MKGAEGKHENTRVIDQLNGGVSSVRNNGVANAHYKHWKINIASFLTSRA